MPKSVAKKTIAVEIDDVLAAHADELLRFSNQRWGTNLSIEDYDEHWAKMWHIDRFEVEKRAQEFFRDFPEFKHFPDALDVLKRLSEKYRLVILTSRRHEISKDTEAWLNKYFHGIFDEIHYSSLWNKPIKEDRASGTKGRIVKQIGADYLIDDQPKHCVAAAEAGITALLFGNYPWNREQETGVKLIKVKDWQAVEEYFRGQG